RILWVLPFVPWPVKVRSFNLIPRLAARHEIDLVCVARSPDDFDRLETIAGCCASVRTGTYSRAGGLARSLLSLPTPTPLRVSYVSSPSMRGEVRAAIAQNRPDVICVERWRALQYVPLGTAVSIVCDPTDSMALYNLRLMKAGRPWERLLGLAEYLKFRRFEPRLARRVAATVFCSRADLDFVRQGAPDANLVQIPNGVDCNLFSPRRPGEEQTADIFFSGNFLYSPNRDAVRFFLKAIFPLVRQAIPDATFTVVGNGAAKFMAGKRARIPGVRVFDFVPDLRAHLARASVAVAPMRVGAGVSNKLLEAFAVGTPTVSTRMASGDLPVRDGEHLFLADGESLFAERVILLLKSPDRRRSMAARAQTLVKNTFDWEIVSRSMEDVLYGAALSPAQAWARSTTTQPTASAAAMAAPASLRADRT
ncbi:MAG: glycosyltransferase, partial [Terriglobales bacterium]